MLFIKKKKKDFSHISRTIKIIDIWLSSKNRIFITTMVIVSHFQRETMLEFEKFFVRNRPHLIVLCAEDMEALRLKVVFIENNILKR